MRSLMKLTTTVALMAAAACAKGDKAAEQAATPAPPPAPATVHVVATDYALALPDTLTAGLTSFHLMNQGKEIHHMAVLRLAPGMTPADLAKMDPAKGPPEGMVMVGGPNFAAPGGSAEAVVDLQPGSYVAMCLIPSSVDGKPHVMKGMSHAFTVVAPAAGAVAAVAPTPDITITLSDYTFTESTPLTAGHHVIKVENSAAQGHELVFIKVDSGKTMADVMKWGEKPQGPPPFSPMPGTTGLSTGQSNIVSVDLVPGDYAFLCFYPDTKDGKPHVMHGMAKPFKIS